MAEGVPERVGPYRLQSWLGAGGMGEVFLALDPDGRTVAVKLLHPGSDEAARSRLDREAATMRRVRSPYVADVLGTGVHGTRPYVATRYVQGRPLDTVVREHGPLGGDELLRVARGLAAALVAIHAAGIVHRDLKPANVMLVDGQPVVIDFGIAYAAASTRVTEAGAVIGTAGYVAPEVLRDERAGAPADVFAWAATVVYAATGRSAFGSGPLEKVFYRVLHEQPDLAGVPGELLAHVQAGLVKDPVTRPDAADLLARLGTGDLAARTGPAGFSAETVPATAPATLPVTRVATSGPTGHGDGVAASAPAGPTGDSSAGLAAEPTTGSTAALPSGAVSRAAGSGASRKPNGRSHAARRRDERMRRIHARRSTTDLGSRRGIWWLVAGTLMFAAGMAAADDHISVEAKVLAHAAYAGVLVLVFAAGWVVRARRGAGAPVGLAARIMVAAAAGSGLAVLLGALVSSTVMTFVVVIVLVLGLATLVLSG